MEVFEILIPFFIIGQIGIRHFSKEYSNLEIHLKLKQFCDRKIPLLMDTVIY